MRFFLNPTPIILLHPFCSGKPLPAYNGSQGDELEGKSWERSRLKLQPGYGFGAKAWCFQNVDATQLWKFHCANQLCSSWLVVGGWCVCGYFRCYSSIFFFYCNNWAAGVEALQCSDTTKTQWMCRSWTLEWPKLCNTKGPHAAYPWELLPAAQQIIGPTDSASPLQFCELDLCQTHKTPCQNYFCGISPKSILHTFLLGLFSGHCFKSSVVQG